MGAALASSSRKRNLRQVRSLGAATVAFDVLPQARSRMISIRIPGDLLDGIRTIARARKVRYQSLIKRWLWLAVRQARRVRS